MPMKPGQILVADHEGVYVIKMIGDVRLTLCLSFDRFIDSMFSRDDFVSILFDLSEAEAIDSTTLGLMAKISIFAQERRQVTPVVVSTNGSINRLLESMGFNDIFEIIHDFERTSLTLQPQQSAELQAGELEEGAVKDKVLEAHQVLMGLNESNQETFRDLVKTLEES